MKRLQKMKLLPKTFLFMLAMFGMVILVMHISIYLFLPGYYLENVKKDLDQQLEELSFIVESLDSAMCDRILAGHAQRSGVNLAVEQDGVWTYYEGSAVNIIPASGENSEFEIVNVENVEAVVIRNREMTTGDGAALRVQISANIQPGQEAIRVTLTLIPLTSAIAVLFSVLFAFLYSKKLTKPIQNMLQITKGMKHLEPDAYFQVECEDEIGVLLLQINQVYQQLWQTISALEQEKLRISQMEQAKVDFLRSASHELKTPLAGLRILLENIQLGIGKYKDHTRYLGEGIQMVDTLSGMVKEILDSSRIQGEVERVEKDELRIADEVAQVLMEYEIMAKSKGLIFHVQVDGRLKLSMNRKFFRQVLSNLLSNAVRYTDQGGGIRIEGRKGELSVWNACTPLSEEQLSRIFEPFYRPDFSRSAYDGGSGLGLYLVGEILRANEISFSFAAQGQGMCFQMELPGALPEP